MAAAAARADWRAHSSASSRRPPRPPRAPTARAASLRAPGPSSRAWKSETTRLSVRGADTLGADQRWWGGGGVGGRYQPGCPPGDSAEVGTRPPALAAPCPLTSQRGQRWQEPAFRAAWATGGAGDASLQEQSQGSKGPPLGPLSLGRFQSGEISRCQSL